MAELLKKQAIISILLLTLFCGCDDSDSKSPTQGRAIEITVEYKDQDGVHIDHDARIYIYYGIYSTDISNFIYSSNGTLTLENGNQRISPDIETKMKGQKYLTIISNCVGKITIIAESSHFQGLLIVQSEPPGNMPIKHSFIFNDSLLGNEKTTY